MTIDENRKIKYLKEIFNNFKEDDFDSIIEKLNYIKDVKKIYEESLNDVNKGYELCAITMLITYDPVLKDMVENALKERIKSLDELYNKTKDKLLKKMKEGGNL